jgi:hypothetical protein
MLVYNALATLYLAFLGLATHVGVLLWPAAVLHAALAVWCLREIRRDPGDGIFGPAAPDRGRRGLGATPGSPRRGDPGVGSLTP